MAIEEGYTEGLDALLSGKISKEELSEIGKAILYGIGDTLPGVGIYREFKKPKGKRKLGAIIGFGIYTLPFLIKVTYFGMGVITKEWNPVNYFKNAVEKKEERNIDSLKINKKLKEENGLEKTINYEELLK